MREVELKFAIDGPSRARLAGCGALAGVKPRRRPMTSLYLDTPAGELAARHMTLRLRHLGGRWIPGLKGGRSGAGGMHARDEWEHERDDPVLDLARFAGTPLADLPGANRLHRRLMPIFEVDVVRTAWIVVPPGAKLEVALDVGEVRAHAGREPISEVEIESLEGDASAAFELAMRILDEVRMRPSAVTKAERGYRLARAAPRVAVHARPVLVDASMTPRAAARDLVGPALEQLQANEEGVLDAEDAEFVHQARVALRRMRSMLRVFRVVIGRERSRVWRSALGELASALGAARDWDVFALETLPALSAACARGTLPKRIAARANDRRLTARSAARAAFASPRYARTVLDIARWMAELELVPAPGTTYTLEELARRVIRKRHKRVRDAARRVAKLDGTARHALRIDVKRLRYGVEALGPLLAPHRAAHYRAALVDLQDALGKANDAIAAQGLLHALGPPEAFAACAGRLLEARSRGDIAHFEKLARSLEHHAPKFD
jgi:inorganic triphosphatase YgiF